MTNGRLSSATHRDAPAAFQQLTNGCEVPGLAPTVKERKSDSITSSTEPVEISRSLKETRLELDSQQSSQYTLLPERSRSDRKDSVSIISSCKKSVPHQGFSWGPWVYVVGMFILEMTVWGFPSSYGVLLDYYLHSNFAHEPNSTFTLTLVGTLSTGCMALLIPIVSLFLSHSPHLKSNVMYLGLAIMSLCMLLSSFSTNSVHVLLTLGLGYSVGGVAVYYPALTYLPEWFPERPGLANGIVFSGNGIGGLILPFLIHFLLEKCGVKMALVYLTLGIGLSSGVALCMVRPRSLPSNDRKRVNQKITSAIGDPRALKMGALWFFVLANTLETFSYFLPTLYLANYAHSQGLPAISGTALLAALNVSNIVSRVVFGALSDAFSTHFIGATTSLVAALSVFFLWGFLKNPGLQGLMVFAIIFGVASGAWTSLYFAMIKEWEVDDKTTMSMYSIFAITRGLGNIFTGPISSALLDKTSSGEPTISGFTSSYSKIIAFCGVNMLATAIIEAGLYVHQGKDKRTSIWGVLKSRWLAILKKCFCKHD